MKSSKLLKLLKSPKAQSPLIEPSKSLEKAPVKITSSEDDAVQLFCKQMRSLDIQDEPIIEGIEKDESAESEKEE